MPEQQQTIPEITVTIDGEIHCFTLKNGSVIYTNPEDVTTTIEIPEGGYDENDADEDQPEGFGDAIARGETREAAKVFAELYVGAPYLDLDEFPILAILDEVVLHLLGLHPELPANPRLSLIIKGGTLINGGRSVSIPTTGTECNNFNARATYKKVVA